jgi:hypothetical protein
MSRFKMNATDTVCCCFTIHWQDYDRYFLSAILYSEGMHFKYFTKGRDVYEEYYGYFIQCSEILDPRHKPVMHAKMIYWLSKTDSDETADWWACYWTGPWTLADCCYCNCTHQNHQEGSWWPLKRGTECGAHDNKLQALGTCVSPA